MKRLSVLLLILAVLISITYWGCSISNTEHRSNTYDSISFSPPEGQPGTIVTINSSQLISETDEIYFSGVKSYILPTCDDGVYQTIVPFCDYGYVTVEIRNGSTGEIISVSSFKVLEPSDDIGPPGEVTTQLNNNLISVFNEIKYNLIPKLHSQGILNNHNRSLLESEINRYLNALNNMRSEISALSDYEKEILDQAIYASGVLDMITEARANLRASDINELYLTHHLLVTLDVASSMLTLASRTLFLVTAISALMTGPGAAIPGSATIIISAIDNIIDGLIPTDLEELWIDNRTHTSRLYEIDIERGDSKEIFIMGRFSHQTNVIHATLNVVTVGVFGRLKNGLTNVITRTLTRLGLNILDKFISIGDDWDVIPDIDCRIDPNLYGGGILSLRTILSVAGLFSMEPVASAIIFILIPTHDYKTLNSSIANYNKITSEIGGVSVGSTSLEYGGYRFKKMNNSWWGVILNAVVGLEYPQSIDDDHVAPFIIHVTEGFPNPIDSILTPEQIEILEGLGLEINPGLNPPNVEGKYLVDSFYCIASNIADDGLLHTYCDDYCYEFYNQSPNWTLDANYYALEATDSAVGIGSFISGTDSLFSIFLKMSGRIENGGSVATYTLVEIVSGAISMLGIRNFEMGFIMIEKDDPDGILVPINSARVWIDSDGLSERIGLMSAFKLLNTRIENHNQIRSIVFK